MSQTSAEIPTRGPPLSNAERQRRWRERLKAKASGAAVIDHVRDVVARAILALWAYHERPGPGGTRWVDIDGCERIEDYVFDLAGDDRGLIVAARAFLPAFEGLTPEEARAVAALIELADVIALRAIDLDDVIELRGNVGEGVLAKLLTPRPTAPGGKGTERQRATAVESKFAPVPSPPAATDILELETLATEIDAETTIRMTAARRARRRALRQRWK